MRVKWTQEALKDFHDMLAYIADKNFEAAKNVAISVKTAANSLAALPHRGRPGVIEGTRELLVPKLPYFFVFWIREEQVEILRFMHFSRKWPRLQG